MHQPEWTLPETHLLTHFPPFIHIFHTLCVSDLFVCDKKSAYLNAHWLRTRAAPRPAPRPAPRYRHVSGRGIDKIIKVIDALPALAVECRWSCRPGTGFLFTSDSASSLYFWYLDFRLNAQFDCSLNITNFLPLSINSCFFASQSVFQFQVQCLIFMLTQQEFNWQKWVKSLYLKCKWSLWPKGEDLCDLIWFNIRPLWSVG